VKRTSENADAKAARDPAMLIEPPEKMKNFPNLRWHDRDAVDQARLAGGDPREAPA